MVDCVPIGWRAGYVTAYDFFAAFRRADLRFAGFLAAFRFAVLRFAAAFFAGFRFFAAFRFAGFLALAFFAVVFLRAAAAGIAFAFLGSLFACSVVVVLASDLSILL